MKVLLVDIDSKIPNLALMKISTYHKNKGDLVGFNIQDPELVYVSCIFDKNREQALGLKKFYPNSKIIFGGSGINYNTLPDEIEFLNRDPKHCCSEDALKPDYDLYPSKYSQGYTTRGCTKQCSYCIVHDKEGRYRRHQEIREFHDKRFDTIMIMDNNWLADRLWFLTNTDYILEKHLKVIEHGMDVYKLDEIIVNRLKQLKFAKPMKFAFDEMKDEKAVLKGIELLKSVGIDLKRKVMFYVLVGFNTTHEEDLYRIKLLREHNVNAFVMQYKRTKETKKIAHIVNRKEIYWSKGFSDAICEV